MTNEEKQDKRKISKTRKIIIIATVIVLAIAAIGGSSVSASNSNSNSNKQSVKVDPMNMAIGDVVTKANLDVCVNEVQTDLVNFDGSEIVCVNVTYTNNSKSEKSFNVLDWKAVDDNGAATSSAYYSDSENELHAGKLLAGGSVTGNVYFKAPISKILYYDNVFDDNATGAWVL